ncbi:MAG TPA: FMN-binding protein [Trebonia sp.]
MITATLVGLIGVLEFHTRPAGVSVGAIPAAGATAAASPAGTASSRGSAGPAAQSKSGSAGRPGGTRTAVGPQVNYSWGVLSVSVTVSGTKITKVGIASLDDGGNPRSQYIDQQSIPILEQQAMQAQSANIQGVSGASYTSGGFQQSLQGALHQLGLN